MRLCSFIAGGRPRVGVLTETGDTVVAIDAPDMLTLIRSGQAPDLARAALAGAGPRFALTDVQILAPIPRPDKNIFCVGLNYRAHTEEYLGAGAQGPTHPILFSKSPTSVIGPGAPIERHARITQELDYEAELAVIIGKTGRAIRPEDAYDYVFGYTLLNDVTARDLQRHHQQWLLGKSLDTFCPMGPYLVTSDEVPWPVALDIRCRVNGEVRQESNTRHLIFDIPTLIATISAGHTLEAGDIIATGTCAGVGMSFNPPRFLQNGDVVEVEIEGLGILQNPVRQ